MQTSVNSKLGYTFPFLFCIITDILLGEVCTCSFEENVVKFKFSLCLIVLL